MELLLRLFDIVPAAGTATELWWETALGPLGWTALVCLMLLAGLAPLRTLAGLPWLSRMTVACLRISAIFLLGLLLLKPSLVLLSPVKQKERLAVLVDVSRSMSVAARGGQVGRWQAVKSALDPSDKKSILARLSDQFDLDLYSFGSALTPLGSLKAMQGLEARDEETELGSALEQLSREGRDLAVGGLVLVSDGIDRGGLRRTYRSGGDEALRRALEPLGLPIFPVVPGEDESIRDVSLDELSYNEFAFLRQPFVVTVTVRALGLKGQTTLIRLRSSGKLLASRRITLPDANTPLKIPFEINPEKVGKFTYTIDTPVLSDEAVVENNQKSFTLKVVRDRIRVLQVAGAPSWDVKFLRRLLKSDPNIDLVSFFILRGPTDQGDFAPEEYSLIEFPYQDLFDRERDLSGFDVVIFQNFAYRPYLREQSARLLASIADYVREGGGLAMLGGELSFAAGEYAGTPVEEVLPVRMDRVPSVVSRPVSLVMTEEGLRHPVTTLHFDPDINRKQWEGMPPGDGFNPTSLQPDSVMLASVGDAPELPLLAVRKVGRGRSLALMSDSSWYWSFRAVGNGQGNLTYLRFWKNALRWLVGDPDEGQLQVDTERENYRLGEEAVIQVRVVGADYGPVARARLSLEIVLEEGTGQPVKLEGMTGEEGEWVTRYKAPTAGPYRVRATVSGGAQARGSVETVFTVSEEGPEMKELATDRAFLEALARTSGGALLPLEPGSTLPPLALKSRADAGLAQRTVIPLWDRLPPYLCLLTLLSLEWLLRRRLGLR